MNTYKRGVEEKMKQNSKGLFLGAMAIIIFMAVPFTMNADVKTLVQKDFESGVYGGPAFKFTTIDGKFCYLVGGGGTWLINHRITIGGMWYGLVSDLTTGGRDIDMDYGGFDGGFVFFPDSVVHFTAHVKLGCGNVSRSSPGPAMVHACL
jgi:hypothetical protein